MSKRSNRIIDETWLDGNKRFPSIEQALQYFKKKGLLENYVDEKGETRWAPTPYGVWALIFRSGLKCPVHGSWKAAIKLLKKRGLIHRKKLPKGKYRWWPTVEGFEKGLGAKSGLFMDAMCRIESRRVF
jgi:hypothetical protein